MELQEQIDKEREKLAKLDSEKAQAEQQGDQDKAAELSSQMHRTRAELHGLEAQADLLASYQGEGQHEPEEREEMEVSSTSRTVYQRGGRPTTFRSSIYDVADRMGMNATTTTVTTSVELDSTQRGMVSAGVTTLDDLAKNQQQSSSLDKMHRDFDRQHQAEEKEREREAEKLTQFVRGGTAERGQVQQGDRRQEQDADLSGSFGPASDYKPEPQPAAQVQQPQQEQEAAQGVEIDGQHFRHMEDGDRVKGEIVNTVEMEDGSKFYAVEATGADWETDRVLVPVTEQEHEIGDRIRATMQADEVNTREDANDLTR
ncbi:hypothetical protein B1S15_24430 [Salmonella enterica]|nr:hypothetical protein [Salmonella enterica]EAY0050935.1 hypothetical protein [Salmonella enterica]EAY0064278.1 hypothetical protein [Salmonella enterica]EBQ7935487.1 hypothetical protein [Salmonella enterica]EHM2496174.1 hypothetical protein [Salmonella enterica subsp. enterica serovar Havana]